MAEDETGTSGRLPGLVGDFVAQLRGITEGVEGLARIGQHLPSAPGALPLPGTLTAAQLTSISDAIAAQRRSIDALKAQLASFDEQLAVLEQIVRPLTEWSGKWADIESRLLNLGRPPKGEGRP